ncbi:hypothetical protein FOMPIDRAFT_88052 [Fomitopsis schrenkii]|uniref:Uncharacterized protein n=1 Tax=Fomitopsis schrenkii TaxID=2126942 RepID=S8E7V3_FOMSC|nr:hypothetical protein FOMPIDRAFT_88052 [Fomitopsis schrenkii]
MSILDAPGAAHHVLTHSFPITPKLVVILRDRLLTHEAGFIRSGMPAEEARKLTHQDLLSTSYFHDLPRTMPTVMHYPPLPPEAFGSNGETIEDDWLEEQRNFEFHGLLPDGQLVASRIRDRLIFDIHNLTEDQAERVNTLLLTHCKETISFRHPTCLLRSIDAFERDTQLTFYGKKRYASLKTKIIGLSQQATPSVSTSGSPVHSPSPEASTDSDSPLPTPTSASKLYPGGGALTSPPASKGVTLEESLPGLRGAFIRKPRVVSMVPSDAEVEDPSVTPPGPRSVCSAELDCTSEKDTEVLHIVSPCVDTGTSVLSSASADSALCPAASSHHTSNEHATAESSACSPAVEDQAVRRLETALPCLRGAFKRGSDILSPEKFIPVATHRTVPVESAPCSDGLTSVSSTCEHCRTASTVDEKIDDDVRAVVGSGDDTERMELEASHFDKSLRPSSTVPTEGPRANREALRVLPCGRPIPATVDKGIATHAARVQPPRDNSVPTGDYYAPEPQNHVPARRTLVRRLLTLASKLFCS